MTTRILRSALLPYPAAVLYGLVNDVARYPEFLPWCSATEVLEVSEVQMLARLVIAKGGLSQRFVTRNQLQPGQRIAMPPGTASQAPALSMPRGAKRSSAHATTV